MSVDHYENFPVASWLCPPALRPAVVALYRFARTADDLADEGDAAPTRRLAALAAYRRALDAALAGTPSRDGAWPEVFEPLAQAHVRFRWPAPLLHDLLDAFEQDVVKYEYADRVELLDYCRRSANPVGRLVLHLHAVHDAASLAQSDAICTALQLANFWQDLGVDTRRGRLYVPGTDAARHGVDPAALRAGRDGPAVRALVAALVGWTRTLMHSGAPLVHRLPGRTGLELRLVVQGGLRILDRIERLRFGTLHARPVLRWTDAPLMLARAAAMRAAAAPMAGEPT